MKIKVTGSLVIYSNGKEKRRGPGNRIVNTHLPRSVFLAPHNVLVVEYTTEKKQRQFFLSHPLSLQEKQKIGIGTSKHWITTDLNTQSGALQGPRKE